MKFTEAKTNELYFRELKVNVSASGLTAGCGTYNDPYIITDGKQLTAVSRFISTGSTDELSKVNLPKEKGNYDTIAENTVGSRWCTDKNGDGYHLLFEPSGTNYVNGNVTWTNANVQYYLANAYYKIEGNIELSGDAATGFVGLGGITANTAFRGVIVGDKNDDGTPKYTITNKSANPFINVSNGSVVKDINITVDAGTITLTQSNAAYNNAYFGYSSPCQHYGGVIGEIMGGDNIIDNSYVKYSYTDSESVTHNTTVTLSGTNGTIVPVGGYVGVVVFGGLIFKNMTASKTTVANTGLNVVYSNGNTATTEGINLASETKTETDPGTEETTIVKNQEAWAAIYVNPIVGRVINGYAVNETGGNALNAAGAKFHQFSVTEDGKYHDEGRTERSAATVQHTLKNGTKHYSIADIDPSLGKLDVASVPVDTSNDGTINVPNSQAMFILSLITQSTSGTAQAENGSYSGKYNNVNYSSLSYGTNTTVYGMSHIADYTHVGTATSADDEDYLLAIGDTAANTATPYIIHRYTIGDSTEDVSVYTRKLYTGTSVPVGETVYINSNTSGTNALLAEIQNDSNTNQLQATAVGSATGFVITKVEDGEDYYYTLSFEEDGITKYLKLYKDEKNIITTTDTFDEYCKFDITFDNASKWCIKSTSESLYVNGQTGYYEASTQSTKRVYLYTDILTPTRTDSYNARCVTSTLGYYDIELTGTDDYVLPDSFRGLGSVGYRDDKTDGDAVFSGDGFTASDKLRNLNRYCMKVDTFDGKNKTIDQDIYLNKFENDNYFNIMHNNSSATQATNSNTKGYSLDKDGGLHGVGLFDSIVMKNSDSVLKDFTLSGSVNTEIYNNSYKTTKADQERKGSSGVATKAWYTSGGVVGWTLNGTRLKFSQIALNDLSIRGTSGIGGLLGYSNNTTQTVFVIVDRCSANNISLNLASGFNDTKNRRCGAGAFVGKIREGGVYIYGTKYKDENPDTSLYKEVVISGYDSYGHYTVNLGGFVGYAGNGCQVYDMHVKALSGAKITIGNKDVGVAGGLVGLMQPQKENDTTCNAKFVNCIIQEINIAAYNYAGGLYGGTHNNGWSPYTIAVKNCEMIGGTDNNEITAYGDYQKNNDGYMGFAGGFVGDGFVVSSPGNSYNIEIADSRVSHYTITSSQDKTAAGGFIGYANARSTNSVTCYIHDSSVENCTLGASGKYAGGAIGEVAQNTENKILGYNIKLDTITDGTKNGSNSNIGAWIGKATADASGKTTKIQFTGLAIYGNGFSKNVGNGVNLSNASFVFADYTGKSQGQPVTDEETGETETTYPTDISGFNYTEDTHVAMPQYPYVNINPQFPMGTGEIISGDGAALASEASTTNAYKDKTAEKTLALKIYEDTKLTDTNADNYSRRYTTFVDSKVYGDNYIGYYMQRSIDDDGDRISTYETEKGKGSLPAGVEDFSVIVIANQTNAETTNLINRYIQLVTNTSTDYTASSDYYNIDIQTCKYEDGKFVIDQDATSHGLITTTVTGQKFALNGAYADSKNANTFTLVDVQFMDPLTAGTDSKKIAYHLYVPVYTIKQMEVSFSAAVISGTNSVSYDPSTGTELSNPYGTKLAKTASDTHVDNLDTWYTTYIRYTYSYADLMPLLNSGNLNWNHNKYFYIDKTEHNATSTLPVNTYMILVDPNGGHDKKYQVELNNTAFQRVNNRISFDLTKFADKTNNYFDVSTFNEMIAEDVIVTPNYEQSGRYNLCPSGTYANTGDTRYVYTETNGERTYYEYVGLGGGYDLTLPADYELNESYYISMYVPAPSSGNPLYGYYIRTPEMFAAPSYERGTNNAITKSVNINCYYDNGKNTSTTNRQVYIGNLFEQETELVVYPNDLEIDSGNKTLNIYAKTTIKLKDTTGNVRSILNSAGTDIYHSFNVFLDRKGANGITNTIYGLKNNGSSIKAWYSVGTEIPKGNDNADMTGFNVIPTGSIDLEENYINIGTVDGGQTLLPSNGGTVTIYSRIRLDFDDINNEFPEKVASDTGVSVRAASNLGYDPSSIAFSSMTQPLEEPTATKHIYYRQSLDSAGLNYYAKTEPDSYDQDGSASENMSRLGVSGKYSMNEYMPINSIAQYNISNIEGVAKDAETLSLKLSLQKKTDTPAGGTTYTAAAYQDVTSINSYWGAVKRDADTYDVIPDDSGKPVTVTGKTNVYIECGNYKKVVEVPANSTSVKVEIPRKTVDASGYEADENGYIYINIGYDAKTGNGFTEYANYKVNLSVRLLDKNGADVGGSYADDYLIYTNAKVNHDFLKDN